MFSLPEEQEIVSVIECVEKIEINKNMEKIFIPNKELYSEIENLIIIWSNDGTKTAGTLTRQIMKLLDEKKILEQGDNKVKYVPINIPDDIFIPSPIYKEPDKIEP